MDGVVTDTAGMHAQAWKRLFDEVLTDERAAVATGRRSTSRWSIAVRWNMVPTTRGDGALAIDDEGKWVEEVSEARDASLGRRGTQ
jgi:beta-phosphoglucomutase-like phosphatase (HAD superfamily)